MQKPKIIDLLLFNESRKVAFGLYLFAVACTFLVKKLITAEDWMLCVVFTSSLIGGGSIADKWMDLKKKPIEPPKPDA